MLDDIKQLLVLQERDRKIMQVQTELDNLAPQRQLLQAKAAQAQSDWDTVRTQLNQLESARKESELEVEGKKQLIAKYSLQQFQTKKNEEYRALAHEIQLCQEAIVKLEDQQLDLMEQAEAAQKALTQASQAAHEIKKTVETQLAHLDARQQELDKIFTELRTGREQLAAAVNESARRRYERLLKHKGEKVVVGIDRGVCAGCHMILPPQVLITCQTDQELVNCPNCGRILYYAPEMDLSVPIDR